MANENKNIKELVSDDVDRTAELEAPTWRNAADEQGDGIAESGTTTFDFGPFGSSDDDQDTAIEDLKTDLRSRTETIDRLQFDIERLRSRRLGLEAEVKARGTQTRQLAEQIESLTSALRETNHSNRDLSGRLDSIRKEHEQEIRTLRFELGEAAETVSQHELINEQLASDLVDTRGFKVELERMLTETESQNQSRVAELDHEVIRLNEILAHHEGELATKSEAINRLLEELSSKTGETDPPSELEAVIHEIDNHLSQRNSEPRSVDRERISRVLIGTIDNQELRFPLFKDRLTIGRTQQNDIQIPVPYISRRHAVVVTEGDATRVIDWGSKNGVYVNSSRVTEYFLASGDIVTIGTAEFRYEERTKRDT